MSITRAGALVVTLAGALSACAAAPRQTRAPLGPNTDPNAASLVTSDITLFWAAVDSAPPDRLAEFLQRDYLDRGSLGVRDFIPNRIRSANELADVVRAHRAHYDSTRASSFALQKTEPEIRAAFRRFKQLYAPAVFPDVYFVVGRMNSGGTSTPHGLIVGAEMYTSAAEIPGIVAHELIHFQQHHQTATLLGASFNEGTADFLGAMASGKPLNGPKERYGMLHEHELWQEFKQHLDDQSLGAWMYAGPHGDRPADLGYFIGHRIAEAYYTRATDKPLAIREIIAARNVKELLAQSGYDP
jgi:predicted Zn-dependent protease DUF2268